MQGNVMENEFKEDMISVIIPIYNAAEYISRCLDSVLRNTYRNLEVLCIDDGSTDCSYELLQAYEKEDPRIQVIRKKNEGAASARRAGLLHSRGEYVAMIDADDWIHPEYFETLVKIQKESKSQIIACRYRGCSDENMDDLNPIIRTDVTYKKMKTIKECMDDSDIRSLVWGRIYTREIIGNHLPQVGIVMGEDTLFNILVMCSFPGVSVSVTEERMYYYYMRKDSIMHTMSYTEMIHVSECLLEHTHLFTDDARIEVLKRCAKTLLFYQYGEAIGRDRREREQIRMTVDKQFRKISKAPVNMSERWQMMGYILLGRFPLLYRMFRVLDDPSLLDWEKNIRAARKKEKGV